MYLTLASCCMVYMLSRVLKEKYEKEKLIYTSNTDELTRNVSTDMPMKKQ